MVKTAKELLKEQILSLDRKAKLYKELYEEDPLAGVKKEEDEKEEKEAFEKKPEAFPVKEEPKKEEFPPKKEEACAPEKKEGADKSDMDKLVDVVENLKSRLEALEGGNKDIKKEASMEPEKKEEPKKEATDNPNTPVEEQPDNKEKELIHAYMPGEPTKGSTVEKQPDNISKEEAPKTEEPKKEEAVNAEEPKKEEAPVEGEVKKETEDSNEDEKEKKPIPPVMEKLRLKNIKIESSFTPTLKDSMKKMKLMN